MKILVIGGCGYTGSVLVQDLLSKGHEVTVFDVMWFGNHLKDHDNLKFLVGDIRNDAAVPVEGHDAVILLANIANDPIVDLNPVLSWEINALASMRIADACAKAGVRTFIYASSGSVYGIQDAEKVTEDLPLVPISVYNKTKMVAERAILSFRDSMKVFVVRPASVCGVSPRMRLDVSVNLLTFHALSRKEVKVFGGSQVRPNIHVKDLSLVYQHFLFNEVEPGIYNAGFENISILELAQKITQTTGAKLTITNDNDPRSYRQDSSKLEATGFQPRFSVDDAIFELTEAFQSGQLTDNELWHTVPTMTRLGLG